MSARDAQPDLFAEGGLLSIDDAARLLGVQPRTLYLYRVQGRRPDLRYKVEDGEVWYYEADVLAAAARARGTPDVLDTKAAARRLGLSPSLLRGKRHRNEQDLPWQRDGRRIWYRAADVEAYRRRLLTAAAWAVPGIT